MNLIEMKNIIKDYYLGETIVQALRGIDLKIEKEEFTAIWGPSGSGKTTLLNLIGTIDEPSSGDLYFNGDKINNITDNNKSEFRNNEIGFIFQTFNLIPVLSALENVMLPLQIMGVSASKAKKEAFMRLSDVELEQYVNSRPDKMSGGQRQRVAIARALITNPSIVLADEPTANLDSKTSNSIIEIMKKINKKDKTTFIFSTHDQRLLDQMDRLIQLEDGRITE
ncbi:MAG: ABC transporter ATP-binding protein [Desulfobacteraceae bacterium]|nr:ABC transporter ATP-binding protein [Desulfobacteraceae bacterium]